MERWPNLFIVGPPRTGTTSLYLYLNSVPDIYMSPHKEPHYFAQSPLSKRKFFEKISDKKKYLQLFKKAKDEKIIGEASTSYFGDPLAPELIQQVSPDANIIISLRDPVERIYSNYLFEFNRGKFKLSFHDEIERGLKWKPDPSEFMLRLQPNVHFESVNRYLKIFGHKKVKILIFEEWIKDVKKTANEIVRFLGLNYTIKDNFEENPYNPYAKPRGTISQSILDNNNIVKMSTFLFSPSTKDFLKRFLVKKSPKPKMKQGDRDKLVKFFEDDVRKLEKLLGHKFHWPNF